MQTTAHSCSESTQAEKPVFLTLCFLIITKNRGWKDTLVGGVGESAVFLFESIGTPGEGWMDTKFVDISVGLTMQSISLEVSGWISVPTLDLAWQRGWG